MTATECVRCGRPTPDGYACVAETDRARQQLVEIADMAQAARDVAQRQAQRGGGGAATGKPGSSLPIDLGATARLDWVQGVLTTWARHIGEIRGVEIPRAPAVRPVSGPTCAYPYSCGHGSCKAVREPLEGPDDLVAAARWLADHCEWMRHRPEVDEWLTDVEACARVIRSILKSEPPQYLGPCGADLTAFTIETGIGNGATCDGDVYGRRDGRIGTCRTCGAQVAQDERRAWLAEQVVDRAYRAAHIADAYRINVKTIRSWADRGRLAEHGQDGKGKPLYLVGDVLDLAREAAARRAENEAKRATVSGS